MSTEHPFMNLADPPFLNITQAEHDAAPPCVRGRDHETVYGLQHDWEPGPGRCLLCATDVEHAQCRRCGLPVFSQCNCPEDAA